MSCDKHTFLIGQRGYKSGLIAIREWVFPTYRTCVHCNEKVCVDTWFERK